MSLNFLENPCREPERTDIRFGLCDDQNGQKAYSDAENEARWIATIKNDQAIPLVFTPIDKCIIQDGEYPGHGRCDGMLTSSDHLYFVELKDQAKDWLQTAIDQLESTIKLFMEHHDLNEFRHKKAYVCNKKHKHFRAFDTDLKLSFYNRYRVRLDAQAEIIVI